ncbi:MAG: hypothetical protein GY913_24585 [Proteobacteria bacterium]|nr:hypothetical protein [Pseudomonadota bacterium]MCP4920092.1 hypothetical protein [Pseudomonadota bacterium]
MGPALEALACIVCGLLVFGWILREPLGAADVVLGFLGERQDVDGSMYQDWAMGFGLVNDVPFKTVPTCALHGGQAVNLPATGASFWWAPLYLWMGAGDAWDLSLLLMLTTNVLLGWLGLRAAGLRGGVAVAGALLGGVSACALQDAELGRTTSAGVGAVLLFGGALYGALESKPRWKGLGLFGFALFAVALSPPLFPLAGLLGVGVLASVGLRTRRLRPVLEGVALLALSIVVLHLVASGGPGSQMVEDTSRMMGPMRDEALPISALWAWDQPARRVAHGWVSGVLVGAGVVGALLRPRMLPVLFVGLFAYFLALGPEPSLWAVGDPLFESPVRAAYELAPSVAFRMRPYRWVVVLQAACTLCAVAGITRLPRPELVAPAIGAVVVGHLLVAGPVQLDTMAWLEGRAETSLAKDAVVLTLPHVSKPVYQTWLNRWEADSVDGYEYARCDRSRGLKPWLEPDSGYKHLAGLEGIDAVMILPDYFIEQGRTDELAEIEALLGAPEQEWPWARLYVLDQPGG